MFTKYSDFKQNKLNENIAQAKTFLKNVALATKRQKAKSRNPNISDDDLKKIGLDASEQKSAEQNPEFIKIKNMLGKNDGWAYLFTKLHLDPAVPEENRASLEDLQTLLNDLTELKPILNRLPMEILKYVNNKQDAVDGRYPFERLSDDLEILKGDRATNKFVNELLPFQKNEYLRASQVQKEKIAGIAKAFTELGDDSKANEALTKLFFVKLKDDKSLTDVINRAIKFIKASNNAQASKFLKTIAKVNSKFGENNGAEIVYNDKEILIIEVKSYQANEVLNGNTSHCIARYPGHWESYCGENRLNKQYYIYNFELTPDDNKSVIGITIDDKGNIYTPPGLPPACHMKNDAAFSDGIRSYMEKIGVPFSVLAPMTPEEVVFKKKRVDASRKIVNAGLTTKEVIQYIEDGADPNAKSGIPLQNAVKEDNYEKAEALLKRGARPNIGNCIRNASNLDMIKLLVKYGSDITNEILGKIIKDYDAVEYVLRMGIDPNFNNGTPMRLVIREVKDDPIKTIKLLVQHGARITERNSLVVRWAVESGEFHLLEYLLDEMKKTNAPEIMGEKKDEFYESLGIWAATSSEVVNNKERIKIIEWLEKYSGLKMKEAREIIDKSPD